MQRKKIIRTFKDAWESCKQAVASDKTDDTNLLKDDVNASLQSLLRINVELVHQLHQLLHLLQGQLVQDAPQLPINFLQ